MLRRNELFLVSLDSSSPINGTTDSKLTAFPDCWRKDGGGVVGTETDEDYLKSEW